ncbi:IS200/IS605 family transposase [Levilactobacillus acidifarinae]|uniref:Transposase-like protein n=1 Tax=Levilactobacillus acidifarinae DSM 19394 = JCM 15949 TaxID=1423715 RepID=A0A0R1LJ46_9LACO|nr:IS200/IS605 family transposase [Levilactobacillus acidifarinae]KRK95980.1 transposase-like protein [Levilactobacillus acidifarinae DSM 19394]GEO69284.1 IS200/IS605 family transposase [Levilactobacillus acidifarinae]
MSKEKVRLDGAIYERNYVYNFHFHLIWVTKSRQPVFTTPALTADMQIILKRIAMLNEVTIEQVEIMPDHIHLLISFKPKYAPTNMVKAFKGGSARMFFEKHPEIKAQKFWGGHLWSHSYYMSTLGNLSKETVEKYIANQKRHDAQP